MAANPILEAFGNSRTVLNYNSSRFGKYTDIYFNRRGTIEGCKVDQYMLEKSRLVWQPENERNFHIFYAVLAGMGPEEKTKLGLTKPSDYYYLTQDNLNKAGSNKCFSRGLGSYLQCEGRNDKTEYEHIIKSMSCLSFSEVELREINKLLAVILHVGNFEFEEALIDNLDSCHLIYNTGVKQVCALLDVVDDAMIKAVTYRTLVMRGETVTSPMNIDQAMDVKDALVKGIYGRLFTWIVDKVNSCMMKAAKERVKDLRSIGLLDIFGFENYEKNSFEQLCYNFANENLQQFFIRHLFILEQEEYAKEKISWEHIDFRDNQDVLDLIAARPQNILLLVDEESMFPRGTDRSMLNKLSRAHTRNDSFLASKHQTDDTFGIKHFAGTVRYSSKGFLERNRDTFHGDLMALVQSSKNKFLKLLFYKDLKAGIDSRKRQGTLCEQFKKSLDSLMRNLSKCQPFFIRCLKPNQEQSKDAFDRSLMVKQLRYNGMLETIHIRRKGFPIRYSFQDFLERYKVCFPGFKMPHDGDLARGAKRIARHVLGSESGYQLGATKLFIRDEHDFKLEVAREQSIEKFVVVIQRAVRGWYARRTFQRLKKSVCTIQSMWRSYLARRDYKVMTLGYCRLQALWRSRRLAFRYQFARKRIIGLQAHCRGHLVRSTYHNYLIAVVTVQTYVRAMIARRRVAKMRKLVSIEAMPERRRNKILDEMQNEELESDRELARKMALLDQVKEQDRMKWPMNNDPAKMMERLFGTMARSGMGAPQIAPGITQSSGKRGIKAADGTTIEMPAAGEDEAADEEEGLNIDDDEDISQYKFAKFAETTFQAGHTPNHSKKALKDSLLTHEAEEDRLVSQAVWLSILRFMGDLSEPKYPDEENKRDVMVVDPNRKKTDRKMPTAEAKLSNLRGSMASGLSRAHSFSSNSNISVANSDAAEMTYGQVMGDASEGALPEQVPINTRIFETFGKGALRRVTTEEVENMEDDEDIVPVEHRVVSQTLRRKTKLYDDLNARLDNALKQAAIADANAYKNFGTKSMGGGSSIMGDNMSHRDDLSTINGDNRSLGSRFSKRDRMSRHSVMSDAASTIGGQSVSGMSMHSTGTERSGKSHHSTNSHGSHILGSQKEWNANQLEKWFNINRPTSNLEKLHFIIGYALMRPKIRDEIYCQICKQLTNNNSRSSLARGWLLISLCCGCFPPSDRFIKYLYNFIKEGPLQYGPFIETRMKRTVQNGPRRIPPSAIEMLTCKSKKPIKLTITFMDGTTKTVLADSATTSKEISDQLCEKVGITDRFGFSLFIALFDKVMSIGNTTEHVLDAISTCEQYVKELGGQERCAPWRLFFRKEVFTPWHDTKEDRYATNIIYNQVIRGVKYGEYRYDDDEGYAGLAAKQWYIDFGQEIQPGKLTRLIPHYIPEREVEDDDETRNGPYWRDLIIKAHRNSKQVRQRWEPLKVKQDVVHAARFQWPLLFSRFYEVKYLTSTATNMPVKIKSGDNIILAVTWTKLFMVDHKEKIIGDFTYPEITNINCNRDDDGQVTSFYISTIQNDEYSLSSPESEDIRDLVTGFLDGLKRRSKYAVAMQANPNKVTEGSQFVGFDKGDLLVLEKPWGKLQKLGQAWSFGTNARTKQSGDFPMDCVYVLPALTKPPKETLEMFLQKNDLEDITRVKQKIEDVDDEGSTTIGGFFSLESYCRQFCRSNITEGGLFAGKRPEMPWEWSKDPIKKPMLMQLQDNEDMAHEACEFFQAVMKYMGDYPSRRPRNGNELTDLIFCKPLQSEVLRDELYIQLCKQVTKNHSDISEERGWELLWLSAGLFAPSSNLLPHVNKFFSSRKENSPMIQDCLARLQKTIRVGDRKFAPHIVEVEAIQNKTTQIFHKVYFPDDTDEAFEVESSTRAKDFCQGIANRLRLKSSEGFRLGLATSMIYHNIILIPMITNIK